MVRIYRIETAWRIKGGAPFPGGLRWLKHLLFQEQEGFVFSCLVYQEILAAKKIILNREVGVR